MFTTPTQLPRRKGLENVLLKIKIYKIKTWWPWETLCAEVSRYMQMKENLFNDCQCFWKKNITILTWTQKINVE